MKKEIEQILKKYDFLNDEIHEDNFIELSELNTNEKITLLFHCDFYNLDDRALQQKIFDCQCELNALDCLDIKALFVMYRTDIHTCNDCIIITNLHCFDDL